MVYRIILPSILFLTVISCAQQSGITVSQKTAVDQPSHSTTLQPKQEKVLLILGQDLASISGYVSSGYFPEPGGVTTYVSFYSLQRDSFPAFGALGQDTKSKAVDENVDWGAGPLNAYKAATDYPYSSLVIGLSIAEGSGDLLWAEGGLADIGVGAYDANIRRLARFCKDMNKPIYLRIGYEFDGAWNRGYEKKTSYILAFRRIVDVMRQQGVSNVAYVWQASASPVDDIIDGRGEDIKDWYPGDNYVDWMGLSWFLPADEKKNNVATQRELANEVVSFARLKAKPVMIAESTPQRYDLEQLTRSNASELWDGASGSSKVSKTSADIWQEWFAPFFAYIHANSDVIRAVAYINADWDSQQKWSAPYGEGYWGDSRVQLDPDIRHNWLQEINNTSFWLHGGPALADQLSD